MAERFRITNAGWAVARARARAHGHTAHGRGEEAVGARARGAMAPADGTRARRRTARIAPPDAAGAPGGGGGRGRGRGSDGGASRHRARRRRRGASAAATQTAVAVVFAQLLVAAAAAALWQINGMLADFRGPLLYALLCSVALRGAKVGGAAYLRQCLRHSLAAAASAPLLAFAQACRDTATDLAAIVRRPVAAARAATTPRPTCGGASAGSRAKFTLSPFSPKSTIGRALVRRRRPATAESPACALGADEGDFVGGGTATNGTATTAARRSSDRHFLWLLRASLLYCAWVWRAALVPLALSVLGVAVAPTIVYLLYLLATARWSRTWGGTGGCVKALTGLTPLRTPDTAQGHRVTPGDEFTPRTVGSEGESDAGGDEGEAEGLGGIFSWCLDALSAADAGVRASLEPAIDTAVAAGLVVGLFLVAVVVGVFFTVRIASEGHELAAVLHGVVKDNAALLSAYEQYAPMAADMLHQRLDAIVAEYNLTTLAEDMALIWHQYAGAEGMGVGDEAQDDAATALGLAATSVTEEGTGEGAAAGAAGEARRPATHPRRQLQLLSEGFVAELAGLDRSIRALDLSDAVHHARAALSKIDADVRDQASLALEPLRQSADHLLGAARNVAGGSAALATNAANWVALQLMGIASGAFKLVVFLSVFYYLLAAERTAVEMAVAPLPLSARHRVRVSSALEGAVRGVLASTFKMAAFHALFAWLTFSVFGVERFVYLGAAAASFLSVMPVLSAWMVSVPAALQLVAGGRGGAGALLVALHVYVCGDATDAIYSEIPGSHPYLIGLSVFSGMWAFDDLLLGAISAPLIVCLLDAVMRLYQEFIDDKLLVEDGEGEDDTGVGSGSE